MKQLSVEGQLDAIMQHLLDSGVDVLDPRTGEHTIAAFDEKVEVQGGEHFNFKGGDWVGKSVDTLDGVAEVVEYRNSRDIDLKWGCGSIKRVSTDELKVNEIKTFLKRPVVYNGSIFNSVSGCPLVIVDYQNYARVVVKSENGTEFFTTMKTLREGKTRLPPESHVGKFLFVKGREVRVSSFIGGRFVEVEWIDTGHKQSSRIDHVLSGNIANTSETNNGFGSIPRGKFSSIKGFGRAHSMHKSLSERVLNASGKTPTYADVDATDEIKNFESFFSIVRKIKGFDVDGFELDKDVLSIHKGIYPHIYSKDTICFLPKDLNNLIKSRREGFCVVKPYSGGKWRCYAVGKYAGGFDSKEDAVAHSESVLLSEIKRLAVLHRENLEPHVFEILMEWEIVYVQK